ncbi:hypothetical protein ES708_33830 [subsurface metagenome]
MPGLRIALQDKSDGQYCNMLIKGYIRDDSAFNFTASMAYASITPGAISSAIPSGAGDQVQRVGVAIVATFYVVSGTTFSPRDSHYIGNVILNLKHNF